VTIRPPPASAILVRFGQVGGDPDHLPAGAFDQPGRERVQLGLGATADHHIGSGLG
jgi:hypothetical protein